MIEELKFEVKNELLLVTLKPPRFYFYVSFVDDDRKILSEIFPFSYLLLVFFQSPAICIQIGAIAKTNLNIK
jgi:hypothetical protein